MKLVPGNKYQKISFQMNEGGRTRADDPLSLGSDGALAGHFGHILRSDDGNGTESSAEMTDDRTVHAVEFQAKIRACLIEMTKKNLFSATRKATSRLAAA